MDENKITLTDDEGKEYSFSLLGITEYEERTYAIFMPDEAAPDPDDEDAEMPLIVMLVEFEGENPIFSSVEDENLGNAVLEKFMEEEEEQDED